MPIRVGDYSAALLALPFERTGPLGITLALSPLGGNNIFAQDCLGIQVVLASLFCGGGGGADTLDVAIQSSPAPALHASLNLFDGTDDGSESLRDGAVSNILFGIPFTQGDQPCTIYQIKLRLSKTGAPAKAGGGTPPAVWVSIQGDAAGDPDGVNVGGSSRAVLCSAIGAGMGEYTFQFECGVDLLPLGDYWIVIDGDYDVDVANCVNVHYNTHASGCKFFDAAWAALGGEDIWFRMNYLIYSDVDPAVIEGGAFPQYVEYQVANALDYFERREIVAADGDGPFYRMRFTANGGTWGAYAIINIGDPESGPLTPPN